MIRRLKQVRAGLVRATARAIVTALRTTQRAAELSANGEATATLRLSGPMHLFRSKTYIICVRKHAQNH